MVALIDKESKMKARTIICLLITFLFCTVLVAHPVNASSLFVSTWETDSEIFMVDSTSGIATSLGFAGTQISGLTFFESILYGWGHNGSLYTIDQLSGASALIGSSGFTGIEGAIAANPTDGFLYAADSHYLQDGLVMIDPSNRCRLISGRFR